ncbi:MAG: acyl-CoA thioesterase [Oscillospiraceae bacterium]|nr:acyl-CoA thioesterase [Oscillospiraceae bacterium]
MFIYQRKPYYYETDQMKIVHHSNYIRWFEEARIAYFDNLGYSFVKQEQHGIICPVLTVNADYKKMVYFGDEIQIETEINFYNGIRYGFAYTVKNATTGQICCTGTSTHCFLNPQGKPIQVKKEYPLAHEMLTQALQNDKKLDNQT